MLSHIIVFENFLIENFVKKIKLSPFYLAIALYTISNIIFAVTAINNKEMVVEFYSYTVDASLMLKALFLQTFSLVFLIFLYKLYERKQKFKQLEVNGYGNLSGWILLIYQIFYILLAIFFNVGVVGQTSSINYNLFVFVSLLSADSLFFIIGSQLKSNFLFKLNSLVYLISTLVRGWLGGFVILFFVILCRKLYLVVSIKTFVYTISFLILVALALPFLIDLKFGIRGGSLVFEFDNYFERLVLSLEYLLGRFQHIGHIYIVMSNAYYYYNEYLSDNIRTFILEGNIQYSLYNKIVGVKGLSFSEFVVLKEFNGDWNTNTGLVGWWVVLKESIIYFIAYWGGLILTTYYLIYKYATKQLFLVFSVFMLVYFYHGWLSAFFNLIFLIWILVILKRVKL